MDDRALAAGLEEFIAHEVADKAIPSISYAIADRDGLLATGHVVRPDLGHRLDGNSLFRIGSLTKMFTAIGIMQLAFTPRTPSPGARAARRARRCRCAS
jgi:D-alanyl-D-alanine dipeptidase